MFMSFALLATLRDEGNVMQPYQQSLKYAK